MVLDSGSTPQLPRKSADNLVGHGAHRAVKSAAGICCPFQPGWWCKRGASPPGGKKMYPAWAGNSAKLRARGPRAWGHPKVGPPRRARGGGEVFGETGGGITSQEKRVYGPI